MSVKSIYQRPIDFKNGVVDLNHGAGGKASAQLIHELFLCELDNPFLRQGDDGAVIPLSLKPGEQLVMSTDGHVVSPLFFPGGDLGELAVNGTINDVAVMGAKPLYLTASFILEEGLALRDLKRIVASMANAARKAGIPVVAGDTKVVERGKGDGMFIQTTGLGLRPAGVQVSGRFAKPGDHILVSGTVGDHGVAVMSHRESLSFVSDLESDTAALHTLIADVIESGGAGIHTMRDPTRGGMATTLNEIAQQSSVGVVLRECAIPIKPQVVAACEWLGLDPLYVANEGKVLVVCSPEVSDAVLKAMQAHPLGQDAAVIGEVVPDEQCFVELITPLGGRRVVGWLTGDPLPRIC